MPELAEPLSEGVGVIVSLLAMNDVMLLCCSFVFLSWEVTHVEGFRAQIQVQASPREFAPQFTNLLLHQKCEFRAEIVPYFVSRTYFL
jgi:hypothetical protein